jgi:hypothetical protein
MRGCIARYEAEALLQGLPNSIRQGLPTLLDAKQMRELLQSAWPVRLRFRELAIWGDQVLVARLEVVDNETANVLERMGNLRLLIEDDLARIGKPRNPHYSPHVSLGYFLNTPAAAEARAKQLGQWNAAFTEIVGNGVIEFSGVSLYGFTNMVEFFKAVEDQPALKVSTAALDSDRRLREKGYRKVSVTEVYMTEETAAAVNWDPNTVSGRCPGWATGNMELAYFNETAAQDRQWRR